ncbi:MAG TPA: hypothetical protein VGN81_29835 [Pseudonocardiaceae bacterium]
MTAPEPTPPPHDPSVPSPALAFRPGPLAASTSAPGGHSVLSNRAMAWSAVALIAIAVGLAILLLTKFGDGKHADHPPGAAPRRT